MSGKSGEALLVRAIQAYLGEGKRELAGILLDVLNGETRAHEPVSLVPVEGESTRIAMSAAERAKAYRARRASRSVTETVTNVTESRVTERDERHDLAVTAVTASLSLISDLGSSSSSQTSSLGEASGQKQGGSAYPETIEITEAIRANCAMAGAPEPTPADVVACLAHARQEGRTYPDWASRLVTWQLRKREREQAASRRSSRGVTGSRHVQPAPPGYADELIAAGERRAREGT